MGVDGGLDRGISLSVDAKGFLPKEVFPGGEDIGVHLGVEIVRHGAIDRLDRVIGQQSGVIVRHLGNRGHVIRKPARQFGVQIAGGHDLGPGLGTVQM